MYSKICIIVTLAYIIIHVEAGIITNTIGPKSKTFSPDSNRELEKINKPSKPPKKYTDVNLSSDESKTTYESTGNLNLSKKLSIIMDIPQFINDIERSQVNIPPGVLNNFESGAANDEINNQQIINEAVEYLELESYPNVLDEVIISPNKNINKSPQIINIDNVIHKQQLDNRTVVISDVIKEEKYDKSEDITNDVQIFLKDKTETASEKQNRDVDTTISIKGNDEAVSEEDVDEFIYIDKVENKPEFVTEANFDYFEITADVLIEEPRFKRSINIIEEENLATTASGLKYTGQHKILNNDLYFKNIHS